MGRRILVQRRGKGNQNFRSPKHRKRGAVKYIPLEKEEVKTGTLVDFIHEGGRGTPIGVVKYDRKNSKKLWLPPEGCFIGDTYEIGEKVPIKVGNTLNIKNIPEGALIFNIELLPGDGGKLVRAAGTFATLMTHEKKHSVIQLPSRQKKNIHPNCKATIGIVSGGGITNKPFMKAGAKWHLMKTKASTWPKVVGGHMNAQAHPHGGGSKHVAGKSTTVGRDAPPGRKVGMIAARQTGRKK